jgi:hypothetical protein
MPYTFTTGATCCSRKTTTVTAMIDHVTTGRPPAVPSSVDARRPSERRGTLARPSRTHSGHCTPTAACVWHSGQIVRPQRWHST